MNLLKCDKEVARSCPHKKACYGSEEHINDAFYAEGSDCDKYNRRLWHPVAETAGVEPVRGWIPCSERLPGERGKYLAAVESEAFSGMRYIDILMYDEIGWRDGCCYVSGVSHWMPLPGMPEV